MKLQWQRKPRAREKIRCVEFLEIGGSYSVDSVKVVS